MRIDQPTFAPGDVNTIPTASFVAGLPNGRSSNFSSGFVSRGVDVTLGNLKVRAAAAGNMSLQVSTVSGTYSVYGSQLGNADGTFIGSRRDGGAPVSVTTTPTYIFADNNYGGSGNLSTWFIMDTANQISWRLMLIVGQAFNNNFISIERLI